MVAVSALAKVTYGFEKALFCSVQGAPLHSAEPLDGD